MLEKKKEILQNTYSQYVCRKGNVQLVLNVQTYYCAMVGKALCLTTITANEMFHSLVTEHFEKLIQLVFKSHDLTLFLDFNLLTNKPTF